MREHVSRINSAVRTTDVCRAAGSVTMTMTVVITRMRKSAVRISTDTPETACTRTAIYRIESNVLSLFVSRDHQTCLWEALWVFCPMSSLTHVAHWCISLHVVSILHFTLTHWLDSEVGLSSHQTTYSSLPFLFLSLFIPPWFHVCLWQNCRFCPLVEKW